MGQTVTFSKVFKAEGTSARGPWVRWDYKTDDGGRFPHFAGTQEIPLNTPVSVQTSAKGDIKEWKALGSDLPAGNQQAVSESKVHVPSPQNGSQRVTGASGSRDEQIHRQTAAKVAAKLLEFFPTEEQDLGTFFTVSEQLCAYFATGETVPF